jgi:predicted O-methyltransferase YrrM
LKQNKYEQTANSKQQTANSKQQTANSKQQTANSKQQTANTFDFSLYSQSRMSPFDELALHKLLSMFGSRELTILEIGSWLGAGSTQVFSQYARKIVCIDHWQGNENQEHKDIVAQLDPFQIFQENTRRFKEKVIPIRCDSSEIGELVANEVFDFIFIDGDHRYQQTLTDIRNSLPKLKRKGIISGHDCEGRLTEENKEVIHSNLENDHIQSCFKNFVHMHPGVIKAVSETIENVVLFGEDENQLTLETGAVGYSSIWYKKG